MSETAAVQIEQPCGVNPAVELILQTNWLYCVHTEVGQCDTFIMNFNQQIDVRKVAVVQTLLSLPAIIKRTMMRKCLKGG